MSAAAEESASSEAGSWFGTLGASSDGAAAGVLPEQELETLRQDAAPYSGTPDAQFMLHPAGRLGDVGRTSVQRSYRTFLGARAVLGLSLLVVQSLAWFFGPLPTRTVTVICALYVLVAVVMWRLPRLARLGGSEHALRLPRRQAVATVGIDLLVFGTLHVLSSAGGFNYAALLGLPVLMAGVLLQRLTAMGVAAGAALWIMGVAVLAALQGADVAFTLSQAGLVGMGLFLVAWVSNELAARLAREEHTARGGLEMARQQAQLNRLVIDEMQEGVLVVDRQGRVRAANPAARTLLAADGEASCSVFQLRGVSTWRPLIQAMEEAFVQGQSWPMEGRPVVLSFEDGQRRQLQLRMRFTQRRDPQTREDFCVLFMEDVRTMQARARHDKLAAMGRVSAGIAHEIRNPLAAIAQANALLAEDAATTAQRQLTQMVSDNVDRLKRIVDDVMEVAPGGPSLSPRIQLVTELDVIGAEWARTAGIALDTCDVLKIDRPTTSVEVAFDPHHLRRVMVNLLDNALRHGSSTRAAVWVRLTVQGDQARISVFSDGDPIAPEVERYLFEPFFSTRSRGSGLGLYICRELCARHGATIDFHLGPPSTRYRNEFCVVLRICHLDSHDTARGKSSHATFPTR